MSHMIMVSFIVLSTNQGKGKFKKKNWKDIQLNARDGQLL